MDTNIVNKRYLSKTMLECINQHLSNNMKLDSWGFKLSNSEAELKKSVDYKNACN